MRARRIVLVLGMSMIVAACGGVTDTLGGGSPADSGAAEDGSGDRDGGVDAPTLDGGGPSADGSVDGSGIDAGVDCDALLSSLEKLQAAAQRCCANCNIVQCTSAVAGLCCDISVTSPASQATEDFEAALTEYKRSCASACPAISCPRAPSGICGMTGECE